VRRRSRSASADCPEAILLDWNMPVMDGYEFLAICAACPAETSPRWCFCTTENDVAHIARALGAGANEYIMKPFDKDIVAAAKFQEVGVAYATGVVGPAITSCLYG